MALVDLSLNMAIVLDDDPARSIVVVSADTPISVAVALDFSVVAMETRSGTLDTVISRLSMVYLLVAVLANCLVVLWASAFMRFSGCLAGASSWIDVDVAVGCLVLVSCDVLLAELVGFARASLGL